MYIISKKIPPHSVTKLRTMRSQPNCFEVVVAVVNIVVVVLIVL